MAGPGRYRFPDNTIRTADPDGAERALVAVKTYAATLVDTTDPERINRILRAFGALLERGGLTNFELAGLAWGDVYLARKAQVDRAKALTGVQLYNKPDGAQTPRGTTIILPWGGKGEKAREGAWSPPGEARDVSGNLWASKWRDGDPPTWPPWDWKCGANTRRMTGGLPGEERRESDYVNHMEFPWAWGVEYLHATLAQPEWSSARALVRTTVLRQALHNAAASAQLVDAIADGKVLVDDRQRLARVATQLGLDGNRSANAVLARWDATMGQYLGSTERQALDAERGRRDDAERSALSRSLQAELSNFANTGQFNAGKLGTAAHVQTRSADVAQLGVGVGRAFNSFRDLYNPNATPAQQRDAARSAWQAASTILHAVPLLGSIWDVIGSILNELPMARGGDTQVDGPWGVAAVTIAVPGGDPAPGSAYGGASLLYAVPRNRRLVT